MLLLRVSFEPVRLFLFEPARPSLLLLPFLRDGQVCLLRYATLTVKAGQADLVTRINEVLQGGLHNENPKLTDRQYQPRQFPLWSIENHALHLNTLEAPLGFLPPK